MFLHLVETRGLMQLESASGVLASLNGVLERLVRDLQPELAAHFDLLSVSVNDFAPDFFRELFRKQLAAPVRLRVWDLLIAEDSRVFFTAALSILSARKAELMACSDAAAIHLCLAGEGEGEGRVTAAAFIALHQGQEAGVEAVATAEQTYERVKARAAKAALLPKAEVAWTAASERGTAGTDNGELHADVAADGAPEIDEGEERCTLS
jgi:hypothetical protein